ncbi:transcription termination factor, mitochondrial-like [Argiope bruennichi]|uniref:Transcription termination factor like protein n=1 Tax=Argiope bruennichi TaxID=94029 RepID=A0A8T0FTR6_ARGBR|nr:transcription termination factor, mitochondrial-like [Argiope bruennichi]XP_055938429.1 transcription termination factor, mitochondrial-like [Argiope bruennichi]XP_055938430.1 transcription termination factor, mitochondrial-like [Argiope bruennichi]XP_055938431.1 transcription termination factor, mitochondrial-like [Argiope bruennichi]KAF8792910.1 Transcription termination factor like protein [Argiope bruennichi]
MLKTQLIFILSCKVRNNLIKSTLRNYSRTACKPKTIVWNTFSYKYLLHQASFQATQRFWLSKLTNISLAKDTQSITDSFLDGVVGIEDSERRDEVLGIVKFLISHGCSEEEIKTKCLHYIIGTQSSYFKVKLLADLHFNIVMLMPLLSCHIVSLRAAAKHARRDNNNRIEYLSHNLDIEPVDLIPMLSKHPSLLTMPFKRLQHKMTVLKQAQISSEYIVKDLWIFNYNEKLLENRISAALKAKVELKPWMLRCSEKFFESMLSKWAQTQNILKGDDEVSYLAKKLDCSEDYVKVLMEKNKLLKTINIPKIEKVLNFLYEKGYTPQEVRLFPRVFCSSVQTLSKRFEEFSKFKATLPTMSQLCISSKKFENTRTKKSSSKEKESELSESS